MGAPACSACSRIGRKSFTFSVSSHLCPDRRPRRRLRSAVGHGPQVWALGYRNHVVAEVAQCGRDGRGKHLIKHERDARRPAHADKVPLSPPRLLGADRRFVCVGYLGVDLVPVVSVIAHRRHDPAGVNCKPRRVHPHTGTWPLPRCPGRRRARPHRPDGPSLKIHAWVVGHSQALVDQLRFARVETLDPVAEAARLRRRANSAASKRMESGVDMHYIVVDVLRTGEEVCPARAPTPRPRCGPRASHPIYRGPAPARHRAGQWPPLPASTAFAVGAGALMNC